MSAEQAATPSVFLLWHTYETDTTEDTKFIGAFSSLAEAEAALDRVRDKDGFRDWPDGFEIGETELGFTAWSEGFIDAEAAAKLMEEEDTA